MSNIIYELEYTMTQNKQIFKDINITDFNIGYWEYNTTTMNIEMSSNANNMYFNESNECCICVREFIKILKIKSSFEFIDMIYRKDNYHNSYMQELVTYGNIKHIKVCIKRIYDDQGIIEEIKAVCFDASQLINNENTEKYKANHDDMTGLFNRRDYERHIKNLFLPCIFVICDLDGLKLINDILGHADGDKAIKLTAQVIERIFPDDYIARIGGDEFIIITDNCDDRIIKSKLKKVTEEIESSKINNLDISISYGFAVIDSDSEFNKGFDIAENMLYYYKLSKRMKQKNKIKESVFNLLYKGELGIGSHGDRVGLLMKELLNMMGFNRKGDIKDAITLSKLHDIGKISIPTDLLKRQNNLTDDQINIIKAHSQQGFKIVSNIMNEDRISQSILFHHENWDGTGYPFGKKHKEIPFLARVLAVADCYDNLTNNTSLGKTYSHENAIDEIKRLSSIKFDPKIVDALVEYYRV